MNDVQDIITWQNEFISPITDGRVLSAKRSWNDIEKASLVDTTLLESEAGKYWNDLLQSSIYKTIGVSSVPLEKPKTTIGGLCLIPTKDISEYSSVMSELPRLDQIIDSIAPSKTNDYFVIYEDDLFAELLEKNEYNYDDSQVDCREIGKRATPKIKKMVGSSNWKRCTCYRSVY